MIPDRAQKLDPGGAEALPPPTTSAPPPPPPPASGVRPEMLSDRLGYPPSVGDQDWARMQRARDPELGAANRVTLYLDDARRLFDLATDSPLICSGNFETDDVVVLRRLAATIGVDPARATPDEFVRDFPHPFAPTNVDVERDMVVDTASPRADVFGVSCHTATRLETDEEVYARLGEIPDSCTAGGYNRRCRRPAADPIHHAEGATA